MYCRKFPIEKSSSTLFVYRKCYLSDKAGDDFMSNFRKRVAEEAAKESDTFKSISKDDTFKKLRQSIDRFSTFTKDSYVKSNKTYNAVSEKYTLFGKWTKGYYDKVSEKLVFVGSALEKVNEFYRHNIKEKMPELDKNGYTYKTLNFLNNETIGFVTSNAPNPYKVGSSENLRVWTDKLEKNLQSIPDKTGIFHKNRRGLDWFLNDYVGNFEWVGKARYYMRNSENVVFNTLMNGFRSTKNSIKMLFINKDSIDTYNNIYLSYPNFNREKFIHDWENKVIPGILDAIVSQKDMELLKKWTTPECYQLIASSKDFFSTCKVVPVIIDVYDCDIVTMKRVDKSSSSVLLVRFSVITNQKVINIKDPSKSKFGDSFNEVVINWAIQTDPSKINNELIFNVADLGNSISLLYGYSN